MTLKSFIDNGLKHPNYRLRAHLDEQGFDRLYVRYTEHFITARHDKTGAQSKRWKPVLDIASIAATKPGHGAFTQLFLRLRRDYPWLGIFVECVQIPRFQKALERMGFEDIGPDNMSPNFWMPPSAEMLKLEESRSKSYRRELALRTRAVLRSRTAREIAEALRQGIRRV